MGRPVLVSAGRTAIGKFQGGLASFTAPQLGGLVVKAALARANIPADQVEEVLMGCVLQAGLGQNPSRQSLRLAGIPDSVAAVTINKVCGSGLKTVMLAAQAIKAGDLKVAVAGGMESMSNAPYYLPTARTGTRLGHAKALDAIVWDGLWDHYNDFHMGITAELVAKKYSISRQEQDAYAAQSHRRAIAAQQAGRFDAEIVAVEIKQKKGDSTFMKLDESPRADSTVESLAKLRPAFQPEGGTVTAGNASSINDGASALVVCDEDYAKAHGLKPIARILGYAAGGLAPEWVMMAPEVATKKLCAMLKCSPQDFDLVEMNEAFSVQMIALQRQLEISPDRFNVHGGAVALGHPIGCSGARVLTTLLHALQAHGKSRGIAGLCLGGGNAVVMGVELI
ncbi:acetyl-CoA acetyltransferase [Planctomycetota bacterium]|jgi:acetyl-CoA C-acetyltransferase|nr:acetyl-CoA C-acetyltransferase [Planctomycetota bacterium]MSR38737.1 acetyl-CoA C-acetyltransferase [Planctomycetota bacterium]GDY01484.1 acetyl-CoA acetyltransferase [Planctomycetota bacterium]